LQIVKERAVPRSVHMGAESRAAKKRNYIPETDLVNTPTVPPDPVRGPSPGPRRPAPAPPADGSLAQRAAALALRAIGQPG